MVDRYYDPATGQFLTVDPDVSETGEPYAYAGGDPTNGSDPSGACAWCILDPWSGANPIRLGAESDPTGIGTSLVERFDPAFQAVQGIATGNYLEAAQGLVGTALFAFGGAEAVGDLASTEVADSVESVTAEAEGTGAEPQYVYRIHGGDSDQWGHSWSPESPTDMENPRMQLGLPKGNTGEFLTKALVQDTEGVTTRSAFSLDGNPGGGPEWLFPDPERQLQEIWTIAVDPPF